MNSRLAFNSLCETPLRLLAYFTFLRLPLRLLSSRVPYHAIHELYVYPHAQL